MEHSIRAVGLTKTYQLYQRPIDRLIEMFTRARRHTTFPALENVTFEVERGETLGVIGQNGAGKSTLLKLLCNVTDPTSGTLETRGSIASILELGTGFHPEFTGRDNAALNAAILGLTPADIRRKLPDILEFSELGEFLDRPVKTYSSGMYMRLAFSVAVNVDPDVLVIDEALAVGDGHFQKKCVDKIRQFQEQKRTILFCSHSLYLVSQICRRALWLDHGKVMRHGRAVDVVHEYETFLLQRDREEAAVQTEETRPHSPVRIRTVRVTDRAGAPRDRFRQGEDILVHLTIESDIPEQPIHTIVGIVRSADDFPVMAVGTHGDGLAPISGKSEYELTVALHDVPLLRGDFAIIAYVGDENAVSVFDRRDIRPAFSMLGDQYEVGIIQVKHDWTAVR